MARSIPGRASDRLRRRLTGDRWDDLEAVRDVWDRATGWIWERLDDALEPVWDLVGEVVERATWVLERVEVLDSVPRERWETAADERVCPECGPLHGQVWETGEGPLPPLHVNCRCARVAAGVAWRVRHVDEWRLRWTTRTVWEWRITGWA